MKKKLCEPFCVFLAAVLMIGLLNFPAGAAGVVDGGGCGGNGNNVTWTLDRDGLLTISGTGTMYDYRKESDVPWYSYRTQIKEVKIENGVTTVGQNVFRDCANLESVTLPEEGLETIQNVSFYNCGALTEITIPEGVTSIGESAFGFCGLTAISIPASVEKIGERAFYRCAALASIAVNGANAKFSAEGGVLFDKIVVENPGQTGGAEGGEESGGEGTGEPQTTSIKTLLVWYPAAKTDAEYKVPSGIQTIGSYAFHSALNLTKVTLPEGVTVIEPYAFAYSALGGKDEEEKSKVGIEIPKSMTTIGEGAFYECRGLSTTSAQGEIEPVGTVNFAGSRKQWNEVDIKDKNTCLTNANLVLGDMKQDNIIASGECGDKGSNAVWSLNDKGDFLISGTGAMSNYRSASGVPWANYLASGATEAQDLRGQIKTVTIEGDTVENGAVTKSGITNVGDYAFYDCENLTTVTLQLPSSVKTIGAQAFSNCAALTAFNFSQTSVTTIGDYAFNGSSALTSVAFPETLETIGKRAFLHSGLTAVTIPVNVKSIEEWAFRWCEQLKTFTMAPLARGATPHKSASIGNYALANCGALEKVNFTTNLASLGEYALADCAALTGSSDSAHQEEVWIPENVSNIGSCAFHGCTVLKAVGVDDKNITYCSASGMLMNKDKTCIFFYPPGRISGVCEIPESVTSVVAFAFDGANQLTDVIYKGTKSQWEMMIEKEWISPIYNAPLLNAYKTEHITFEGVETDDSENVTSMVYDIAQSEEGRQIAVTVHCGLNTPGAKLLCVIYDEDGRFLRIETPEESKKTESETEESGGDAQDSDEKPDATPELTPGEDTTLTFALDEKTTKTGQVRLLVLDGYNLPCCKCEIPELSELSEE